MANSPGFVDFVIEQMSLFGPVSARRMFGGHGLYCDGLMPFTYLRAGQTATIASYCEAPPEAFDDRAEMLVWARLAHGAALRNRAAAPRKRLKR